MRFFSTRTITSAMILGAALTVSACGKGSSDADNSTLTEMNGAVEGTTNDMSTIDSATGNVVADANATADNATAGNAAENSTAENAM